MTVEEQYSGSSADFSSASVQVNVTGQTEQKLAYKELIDWVLAIYDNEFIPIDGADPLPLSNISIERLCDDAFVGEIDFGQTNGIDIPEEGISFNTTGGTARIKQSLGTQRSVTREFFDTVNHDGLINVSENGVDGVDIVVPVLEWEETKAIAFSHSLQKTWARMTGTVCNASFREYAEGEVLFRGARGRKSSSGDSMVTFMFSASENAVVHVPYIGKSIRKDGWEYLWVYSQRTTGNQMTATNAYVEEVYKSSNFAELGIGV